MSDYSLPLFYRPVGDILFVFMLKPKAPVDFFCTGASDECPQQQGVIWHIKKAEKDKTYHLDVRVGLVPISKMDTIQKDYRKWIGQ